MFQYFDITDIEPNQQYIIRTFSEGESDVEKNFNYEIKSKRIEPKDMEWTLNFRSTDSNSILFQKIENAVNEETYHHKALNKKAQKKIFIIIKSDEGEKRKEIITGNGKRKVGYTTNRQSLRWLNLRNMIIRNLIQEIIPNWVNYEEKNKNNYLRKINPSILKESNYLDKNKNKTIGEIFELKNVNEDIVENADKEKLIKFKFTLTEIFLAFNQKNYREGLLILKFPELTKMGEEERKIYVNNFYNRLKEKEEYCNEKGGSVAYQKKLKVVFNDLESYLKQFCPYFNLL